ncbi:MAG: phosphate acyltransferase PlsX [Clostridia bacterium]|nr:phosphate acyltransferase PlsX [Clostridia bacterium]
MRIIVDAMGGDNAPQAVCEAVAKTVGTLGADIVLVGREVEIRAELEKYGSPDGITVVNADEVIQNCEEPVKAVKTRKNSSLVVAAKMLSDGEGDALLSCGSTGALLAAGLLIVGRIKGVKRPALATLLPSEKGPVMLIDSGANTNCKAENLVQFAHMGDIYMRDLQGVKSPRIGIMSNGEEEEKGSTLVKDTHSLLKNEKLNFIGNIEGRDVMEGNADVIVTDGFTGNVILKTVEGMGSVMGRMVKGIFMKNLLTKLGAAFAMSGVNDFKRRMDYREYGGAPFLGVKKPLIKGHGSSDAKAVSAALWQAKRFAEIDFATTFESKIQAERNLEDE